MTSPDRPTPRRRATPAPDEAAGATPITPQLTKAAAAPAGPPARLPVTKRRKTYAQLNVRLDTALIDLFESLQEHDGTNQVETVRTLIREAADRRGLS